MHKIRKANRVKTENLIQKYVLGRMSAQGRTVQKKLTKIRATKMNVFKIEYCGSYGRLLTEKRTKEKICGFLSGIVSEKRLLSCSQCSAHCGVERKLHLGGLKRERPALVSADV
jgi:hypothetical protein